MRIREKGHHIFGEGQVSGCGCNIKEVRGKSRSWRLLYMCSQGVWDILIRHLCYGRA